MKLGIYGGTFNPPHTGHLTAARSALEALELDRLVLLPAAQPPHKVLPPGAPSAEQRLDMTAIAADALLLPGRVEASASGAETSRRQLYRRYAAAAPGTGTGRAAVAADGRGYVPQLSELEGAGCDRPPGGHLRLCPHPGRAGAGAVRQARRLERELGARVRLVHSPDIVDISSTRLRALLAAGRDGNSWPRRCTAISSARASTAYTMTGSVCPTGNCGPVPTP